MCLILVGPARRIAHRADTQRDLGQIIPAPYLVAVGGRARAREDVLQYRFEAGGGQQFLGLLEQGDLAQIQFILGRPEILFAFDAALLVQRIDRQTRYPDFGEFVQGVA